MQRPTYLIDPAICRDNIRTMADKARRSGALFRPHFKTHQSLVIGKWFREEGVTRITASSLSAAAYFATDGWEDITVAFPANLREIDLINELAGKIRLGLLVEDPEVVISLQRSLRHPVGVWIKVDTGYHRTGLTFEELPVILHIADLIKNHPMTRLEGLLTHAGHTYHASSAERIAAIFRESVRILSEVRERIGQEGLKCSWGDTPSCSVLPDLQGIDEIRPGNFVFYDLMQLLAGVCVFRQVAGVVACPVVAVHPARRQAVLYGGAVHLSKEALVQAGRPVFGQLVSLSRDRWTEPVEEARLVSLSQEHGILEAPEPVINRLRPGDVVGIIPVHSCLTASALRSFQLVGGGIADYFSGI